MKNNTIHLTNYAEILEQNHKYKIVNDIKRINLDEKLKELPNNHSVLVSTIYERDVLFGHCKIAKLDNGSLFALQLRDKDNNPLTACSTRPEPYWVYENIKGLVRELMMDNSINKYIQENVSARSSEISLELN